MSHSRPRPVPQMSRSHLEVKGQNENCLIGLPCPACISTMHHRIPKLLGTHVHHDKVTCGTQDTGLYLKGQGHTWRSKVERKNHASQNSQVTGHTCSPWWGDIWRTRHRPVTWRSRSHLQVKGRNEKCFIGLYPKYMQCIAVFVNKCTMCCPRLVGDFCIACNTTLTCLNYSVYIEK